MVRRARGNSDIKSLAIRDSTGRIVHEPIEVLHVWKHHFSSLGTPKMSDTFDHDHYEMVTNEVANYNELRTEDEFLSHPFTHDEVFKAAHELHKNKAAGVDCLTSEHIQYAGEALIDVLVLLFNMVRESEYVPVCCRVGMQVPLYKGKDTCTLDPNNYRGITLLSVYNKIIEILIWHRLELWWETNKVISDLQGACRKGLSCVHLAFTLRETVAASLEDNQKCFVAFFDVAKAFDTVWVDGLFYQLFRIGIQGKTWRILYRFYIGFRCCVRVCGLHSDFYDLSCGIHQGGYMSLIKYTVFINSLIVSLQRSGNCCSISRTPSAPLGYADDLATCALSKNKMDKTLSLVYGHGRTWLR